MDRFELIDAASIGEALQLAGKYGKESQFFASGADILYMMKDAIEGPAVEAPRYLINLEPIAELRGIRTGDDGSLVLGPMVRLVDLEESKEVAEMAPILAEAASHIASPQLRNTSTVGGNLLQRPRCSYFRKAEIVCLKKGGSTCWAVEGDNRHYQAILEGGPCHIVHPSDLAPALIAAGAQIRLQGSRGERVLPLAEFFVTTDRSVYRENVLEAGELVTGLSVPATASPPRQKFLKAINRQADEYALVSVAVSLNLDGERVKEARVVLGGVSPRPYPATAAAELLTGDALTAVAIERAGEKALEGARPMSMNAYKVDIAKTLVKRALTALLPGG